MVGRAPFTGKTRVRVPYRLQNIIGVDYGDSRVCKTLAGEFESHVPHNLLSSSNGRKLVFQTGRCGFESRR